MYGNKPNTGLWSIIRDPDKIGGNTNSSTNGAGKQYPHEMKAEIHLLPFIKIK